MGMLTRYNDQQARWMAVSYDGHHYYWSNQEYQVYKEALKRDVKILHFQDGSVALADIRRVEPYTPPAKRPRFKFEGDEIVATEQ